MENSSLPLFATHIQAIVEQDLLAQFEAWVLFRARSTSRARAGKPLSEKSAAVYREMWRALARYCTDRSLPLRSVTAADLEHFLASRGNAEDLSPRYAWRLLSLF